MRQPSIKIELRKVKATDKDGYLFLRVKLANTPPLLKSLGYKVPLKYWDEEKQQVKHTMPVSYDDANTPAHINDDLYQQKLHLSTAFRELSRQGKPVTKEAVQKLMRAEDIEGSFIQFFSEHVAFIGRKDKEGNTVRNKGYVDHWEGELLRIKAYAGTSLDFKDITPEWLRAYETALLKGFGDYKGIQQTTLHTKMKRLREVIKAATLHGHMKPVQIAGYNWPAWKDPERKYLTAAEVDKIADLVYNGELDDSEVLKQIAAYFVVECYAGIRFSDWARFELETIVKEEAFKVRAKKNGEPVYLYLQYWPKLRRMLHYIRDNHIRFNLAEPVANRNLKIVGAKAGISLHLTTHVGRHTCATLLGQLNYSDLEGAEILGITPDTFRKYHKYTRQGSKAAQQKHGGL